MQQKNDIKIAQKDEIASWSNCDNACFYDNLSLGEFQNTPIFAGLDTCCDVEMIRPLLRQTDHILEVGAGYGRVVKYLLANGYKKIFAIERNQRSIKILKDNFSTQITLYEADICDFITSEKYDVILWLWAGITEFSASEQPVILAKLFSMLNVGGTLVVESISRGIRLTDYYVYANHGHYVFRENGRTLFGFSPSIEDIQTYIKGLCVSLEHIEYVTTTGRSRTLFILNSRK